MSQDPNNQTLQADVLLVTVTETETMAVRSVFPEQGWQFIGDKAYYDFGAIGRAKVVLVQSEKGAGGEGGSARTVDKAIDLFSPTTVIMVGIAFGFDRDKRKIGDILVSQQILTYEMQRVSQGNKRTLRGDQVTVPAKMLGRFRHGAMEWKKANEPAQVEFGILLSGAKLIDDPEFRDQVREFAPEAIGGEMEGEGVHAASYGNKVDWILVKAICDWADGIKKRDDEPSRQEYAAEIAARFVLSVIQQGGFRRERPQNALNPPVFTSVSVQPPQIQSNPQPDGTGPINVFISYSDEDEKFKKQLETHLAQMRRDKVILPLYIEAGKNREDQIAEYIASAQIILLLMSPSFIASDQLYENEMTRAIARQKSGDPVRVIPIAVRYIAPNDPDKTPEYQKIQGLPRNGRPIESWRSADEVWAQVAGEIREVCKDLRKNSGKQ